LIIFSRGEPVPASRDTLRLSEAAFRVGKRSADFEAKIIHARLLDDIKRFPFGLAFASAVERATFTVIRASISG